MSDSESDSYDGYYYKLEPISKTIIIRKTTASGSPIKSNDGKTVQSFLSSVSGYSNGWIWEYNLCYPFWINKYYFSM